MFSLCLAVCYLIWLIPIRNISKYVIYFPAYILKGYRSSVNQAGDTNDYLGDVVFKMVMFSGLLEVNGRFVPILTGPRLLCLPCVLCFLLLFISLSTQSWRHLLVASVIVSASNKPFLPTSEWFAWEVPSPNLLVICVK